MNKQTPRDEYYGIVAGNFIRKALFQIRETQQRYTNLDGNKNEETKRNSW